MNSSSQSRKQRRLYEKYLKQTNPTQYREWKRDFVKRGEEYQKQYEESTMKGIESQMEAIQTKVIQSMSSRGIENSKIDEYMEDWLNSTKIWGSSDTHEKFVDLRKKRDDKN
jgi:hypothetical protein